MVSVIEHLNFFTYLILVNLKLRNDTQFSYWKTFKHVWNNLEMQVYFLNLYEVQV